MNKRIQKISLSDPMSTDKSMMKLAEEFGELAVELLKKDGFKNGKIDEGPLGESIDVILVGLSIFFKEGGTIKDFHRILKEKSDKWEKKVIDNKIKFDKKLAKSYKDGTY